MAQIQILGSAAAEAIPAIFCSCRVCNEARKNGGKDVRLRTAYKINDRIRVDFGPDSIAQDHRFGLCSENLRHIFITHSHCDHLNKELFSFRSKWISHPENDLTVYGNATVLKTIASVAFPLEDYKLRLTRLNYFEPVDLPEEDMTFYPMQADHMKSEQAMFFAVRHGEKLFMIANDTGFPGENNWEYMHRMNMKFDFVIADCTSLAIDSENNHMGRKFAVKMKERMLEEKLLTAESRFIVNHFSHNGLMTHAEAEEFFSAHNILVGFDGMIIEY